MVCPSCGSPVQLGERFCDECGTALPASAVPRLGTAGEYAGGSAPAPEPELRLVSVLFVDLVGFTALSEGREAEDVRELLGRYFDVARATVERYGGTIEKFIGDAVMAVWGVPAAHEDDAERAVRAALEIVEGVPEFGATVGAPDLRARAGVVTGHAAAVDDPSEGIVTGDKVNTASRVQSVAQPEAVLVDELTRELAQVSIVFEEAGEHTVKGKAEPLRLWRAARVVAGVGGRDRERLFEAPFVGRDGELRMLRELLDQTVERSSARLVAVSGDPGIGKSRLRREFSNYTDGLSQGFLWHSGRCLAHDDGVAFWALAEMVRQRLRIAEDAVAAEVQSKLDAGLLEWIANPEERDYIRPRLGALLSVAAPGLERAELFGGWRMFFERLTAHDPVVLVFEDMQWADEGLLAFIDQLVEWSRSVPILILTFARPELATRHDGWPAGRRGVTTIDLEPLTEGAMAAILDGSVQRLPADTRDQIVMRAQGNPLYAVETIRALADRGVLERVDERLVAAGEIGEIDTPASLNALLASRLDALAPDERELVKTMSVFSGSFPLEAVAALAGSDRDQLASPLDALVRKQVFVIQSDPLAPDHGQYAFAQALLRTVAYETLSRRRRKHLHLVAAAHLRTAFPNDGEELAEVIADHMFEAFAATAEQDEDRDELRAEVVGALRRSAERAESVGAPQVGVAALTRAAELASEAERPDLLEQAGWLALLSGRYEQALALGEQARDLLTAAGRPREAALAERRTLEALHMLGRPAEWAARLQGAVDVLTPLVDGPDAGLAELQSRLARALAFAGEHEHVNELQEAALIAAEALELHAVLAATLEARATAYLQHFGRPQEAQILYQAAIAVAERHGLPVEQSRARGNLAVYATVWDPRSARDLLERHHAATMRGGAVAAAAVAVDNLGEQCVREGDWARAQSVIEELFDRELGEFDAAVATLPLLMLALLRGDLAAARAAFARIAPLQHSDDPWDSTQHASYAVMLAAAEGRHEQALAQGLALIEGAVQRLGGIRYTPDWEAWPSALGAALALGDLDSAHRLIDAFGRRLPGHMPPPYRAYLARGRGLVAALESEPEIAEANLRDAITRFDRIGYVYWHAATEVDLAGWLIDQGRADEAVPLIEHAISVLEPLRALPVLARVRAMDVRADGRLRQIPLPGASPGDHPPGASTSPPPHGPAPVPAPLPARPPVASDPDPVARQGSSSLRRSGAG